MSDQIQRRALQHWYTPDNPLHLDLMPSILGLVGEAGELADLHKKRIFKPGYHLIIGDGDYIDELGDVLFYVAILAIIGDGDYIDELGDVLFYVAILAHQLGITLEELSQLNFAKLNEREKNGSGYNRGEERE